MRNQQPDNFFREKLANYHKPAPAGAWDRIESSLKKNETKFGWWKVAASLLLLTAIGYSIFWLQFSKSAEQPIARKPLEVEKPAGTNTRAENQAVADARPEQTVPATNEAAEKNSARKQAKPKPTRPFERKIADPEPAVAISLGETTARPEKPTTEANSHQVVTAAQSAEKSSSIKLTITAEESEKYLNKNALAEATSKERKSSTFKKLLIKANELTSNQDPFGDLRVKKNEILALEFRNDKRGQNK
ncbi:MAG TPA: hypothetical protein VFZ52_10960 [Chryseolinea sp.]